VRALRQAAGARQRHLHVQRGHALLQRGVPLRADAARRHPRQAAVRVRNGGAEGAPGGQQGVRGGDLMNARRGGPELRLHRLRETQANGSVGRLPREGWDSEKRTLRSDLAILSRASR
jgi:hypothetical protein